MVGWSIVLAVGFAANGDKPTVTIDNSNQLYSDVQLATVKTKSFTSEEEDVKIIIQVALDVMAVSAVSAFPNNNTPLVNIVASKYAFRASGWAAYCQHTYQYSNLTLGKPRAGLANYSLQYLLTPAPSRLMTTKQIVRLSWTSPEQYPHTSSSLP